MNDELFPDFAYDPMRHTIAEEQIALNGTTLRLLRCRNEVKPKDHPGSLKIGRTHNELVASSWDEKKKRWRDFIKMTVADVLPESMPVFLENSKAEIERLLPKYAVIDKVQRKDCALVQSYDAFAEMLQRR